MARRIRLELHVSAEETVRRQLRGGELRGVRFARKAGWRIRESDLQAYLAAHTNVPQAAHASELGQDGQS